MEHSQIPSADPAPYLSIPLSNGVDHVLIDAADYPLVAEFNWHSQPFRNRKYRYAVCNLSKERAREFGVNVKDGGKSSGTRLYLHHLLMGRREGFVVDHANGDALDNRRSVNLRWATASGNSANSRKRQNKTSQFKGVYWRKDYQCWAATANGRQLGRFINEIDAAHAYDEAAVAAFGEFARINGVAASIEGLVA